MAEEYKGRGGWRGGGRPKLSGRDKQKVHSIRATDKDWKIIKQILPIIKGHKVDNGKTPRLFMLTDEEHLDVSSYIIRGFIEKEQEKKYEPVEIHRHEPVNIEEPQTLKEEEAVSMFLELFRIAPKKAESTVRVLLDKEKRLAEIKAEKEANKKSDDALFDKIDKQLKEADRINEIVSNMLKF